MANWAELIRRSLENLAIQSADLFPRVLISLALVGAGILVAMALQTVVRAVLRRAGLDRLAEQIGLVRFLRSAGYENPASHLAGFVVFWTVLAVFVLTGADALGLPAVSNMIAQLIGRLPPLALAVLVLLIGLSVARTARRAIERVAGQSRMVPARPLGLATFYLLAALSVVVSLSGLGIDFTIVTAVVVVVLAAVGLGIAVVLGVGSRDVARNTISGIYARRNVRVGDRIRVDAIEGRVTSVEQVSVTIQDQGRTWLVPYDRLLASAIEILERATPPSTPGGR